MDKLEMIDKQIARALQERIIARCAYDKPAAPETGCPQACTIGLTHRIRNYWLGEARKKFGPDMLLCTAHAAWLKGVNPMHDVELRPERGR